MSCTSVQMLAYQRSSNNSPFDGEPESGSGWSLEELQWLQVDARTHVSINTLLGLSDSIDDGDYLQEYQHEGTSADNRIKAWLGVSWDEVVQGQYDVNVKTFYGELKNLCSRPVDLFASSPPLPASVSSETVRLDTPTTILQTPSRKRAPTADRTTPKTTIRAGSHTSPAPSATRLLQTSYLSSPDLPQVLTSVDVQVAACLYNGSTPWVLPSDSSYIPSTPTCLSSAIKSSTCDKSEDDVVALARSFLYLLQEFAEDDLGVTRQCKSSVRSVWS